MSAGLHEHGSAATGEGPVGGGAAAAQGAERDGSEQVGSGKPGHHSVQQQGRSQPAVPTR